MVTGDNLLTARAIAVECGILDKDGLAVEGEEFRKWDDAKIEKDLENLSVSFHYIPKLLQLLFSIHLIIGLPLGIVIYILQTCS
jgi:Ca2+-transporting ATPase